MYALYDKNATNALKSTRGGSLDEILPGVGTFSIKPRIGVIGENELRSFIVSLIESGEAKNSRLNRLK